MTLVPKVGLSCFNPHFRSWRPYKKSWG